MIYNNVLELIGNTPIVKIDKIKSKYNIDNELYLKLESKNPGGSIKDRIAYKMVKSLFDKGKINKNSVIIEVTSGNTGIGLAMVCAYFDIKLIVIINESSTEERIKLLKKYGAKLIFIKKEEKMEYGIEIAKKLCQKIENSVYIDQFSNEENYKTHYDYTANEILKDFNNDIDYIFVGMGSTGTIMGISKKIHDLNLQIKVIGIEPQKCPYYKYKEIGCGDLPGLGTTFSPVIYNKEYVDDIMLANKENAINCVQELMRVEGVSVGVSSGAIIYSAIKYMKDNNINKKKALIVCPDSVEKYLSII